jgi:ketosteroid isomerase-like protein
MSPETRALLQIGLTALLLCLSGAASGASDPALEVRRLEEQRSHAIQAGDLAFLGRIYADDFSGVTTTGQIVDKPTLLKVFQSVDRRLTFREDELAVQVIGEVALVSGRVTGMAGDRQVAAFRFLHVYIQRGDQWQLRTGQSTNISQP